MSGSFSDLSKEIFKLSYQISPIILTGDSQITQFVPGGFLPIIALTESINFVRGILGGGDNLNLNDFFGHFKPVAGSTLIDNQVGAYPFANRKVAANAVVTQPLTISLIMTCPARGAGSYLTKLATMSALRATLNLHSSTGGTYIVATPAQIYTDCLLNTIRDVTQGESKQVQAAYQFDFSQPLLTEADALEALNSQLAAISGGGVTQGASSGAGLSVGASLTGVGQAVMGAAQGLGGTIQQGGLTAPLGAVTSVPLI